VVSSLEVLQPAVLGRFVIIIMDKEQEEGKE
jgi:hypothetical protein